MVDDVVVLFYRGLMPFMTMARGRARRRLPRLGHDARRPSCSRPRWADARGCQPRLLTPRPRRRAGRALHDPERTKSSAHEPGATRHSANAAERARRPRARDRALALLARHRHAPLDRLGGQAGFDPAEEIGASDLIAALRRLRRRAAALPSPRALDPARLRRQALHDLRDRRHHRHAQAARSAGRTTSATTRSSPTRSTTTPSRPAGTG